MPLDVMALVLVGALLHASWNAAIKAGSNPQLDAAMVALGAAATSLVLLPFLPLPRAEAWPFVAASLVIHFIYYRLVAAAYAIGDIGLTYPLMRGVAPMIVAATSGFVLKETLSTNTLAGILAICCGVVTLAAESRRGSLPAVTVALANACIIATYTYVDGMGARLAGDPVSYTLWISVLPPVPLLAWQLWRNGRAKVIAHTRRNWLRGLMGGAASVASYGLALWAMTKAPVATVAALRETSILFATLISVFILRETATPARIIAAGCIALGALVLKLG